jgi:RND family efflux transporter MFP subunit
MLPKITRRRVVSAVVVLAAAGAGCGYWISQSGSGTSAAATPTTTTQTVSTGTIQQSVSASGTLAPAEDESLNFSSPGVVTSVRVSEGQRVKKGQQLATIDSASLAATVAQNKATVAEDKARVSSDEDGDASDAQLAADKAALVAARNQLSSAKAALAGATLTSPIDGVVAAVNLAVGQSVSGPGSNGSANGQAGSSSSSAQIEVISTDSWIVNVTVDAASVDLIKVGDQAQLSITGYSGGTVYGTISSIAVLPASSSDTASYPVVIAVTGSKSGLHDGQDVTATLIYKQLSNVIVVPTLALHRNSSGGEYVDKVVDGKVVQTTVQIGAVSGLQTQITSGLSAGDKIQVQQFTARRTGGNSGQPTEITRGNFGGGKVGGGTFGGGGAFGGGGFGG